MSVTNISLINMALSHVGHTQFIDDLTGNETAVEVANVHYDQAVAYVLEDFAWGFARRYWTLELVQDFTLVTTPHDWLFHYRYPVDTAKIRRIVTTLGRRETTPPPYSIASDDAGRLVCTDQQDAIVETTKLITDPALFSAQFAEAVSWWLGGLLGPGLSKTTQAAAACFTMYDRLIMRAAAHDGNESQDHPEEDSEAIRARL